MSFLLAVLITYGRMNMDSEIVVMKAVGMSLRQISIPAVVSGVMATFLTFCMTFYLSPRSATELREQVNSTIKTRAPLSLEEGVFQTAFKGITVMIGHKPTPEEMKDIFIYDSTNPQRPMLITARSGRVLISEDGNPALDIRDGYAEIIKGNAFTELSFSRYVLKINISMDLLSEKSKEKMPMELLRDAKGADSEGQRALYLEFHRRLTLPLINVFIIFLGPALAMHSGKHGRLSGFIYGIAVFGGYYSILINFENLVRSGTLPHVLAWAPLMIMGAVSLFLYGREGKR
jgi:lipopolysaccharide export system permease protein